VRGCELVPLIGLSVCPRVDVSASPDLAVRFHKTS
jgi:hypothetical protein